ncbi:URC1 [Symbiodinium sp. CCMP2592]|nr:URC1 [Symbiodinium sp. CCMP2592]
MTIIVITVTAVIITICGIILIPPPLNRSNKKNTTCRPHPHIAQRQKDKHYTHNPLFHGCYHSSPHPPIHPSPVPHPPTLKRFWKTKTHPTAKPKRTRRESKERKRSREEGPCKYRSKKHANVQKPCFSQHIVKTDTKASPIFSTKLRCAKTRVLAHPSSEIVAAFAAADVAAANNNNSDNSSSNGNGSSNSDSDSNSDNNGFAASLWCSVYCCLKRRSTEHPQVVLFQVAVPHLKRLSLEARLEELGEDVGHFREMLHHLQQSEALKQGSGATADDPSNRAQQQLSLLLKRLQKWNEEVKSVDMEQLFEVSAIDARIEKTKIESAQATKKVEECQQQLLEAKDESQVTLL